MRGAPIRPARWPGGPDMEYIGAFAVAAGLATLVLLGLLALFGRTVAGAMLGVLLAPMAAVLVFVAALIAVWP